MLVKQEVGGRIVPGIFHLAENEYEFQFEWAIFLYSSYSLNLLIPRCAQLFLHFKGVDGNYAETKNVYGFFGFITINNINKL